MIEKIENIVKKVNEKIVKKESELTDVVKDVPAIIAELETAYGKLREWVSKNEFKTKQEEIDFFKEEKPQLSAKLIYYHEIYHIALNYPLSCFRERNLYLKNKQDIINDFCLQNADFIKYYRSGQTFMDSVYFVRERKEISLVKERFCFERDPNFSTMYDFRVAELLACKMLTTYLNNELAKLKQSESESTPVSNIQFANQWTDDKVFLVELIYSIHAARSVNNGNIHLNELQSSFEKIFNVELGDIYKMFLEIRHRKMERTKYLNKLLRSLNERMDDWPE